MLVTLRLPVGGLRGLTASLASLPVVQHPLLSAPVPLPILGSSLSDSLSALSCGGLHGEFREQTLEFASREDAEFWKSFFTFLAFARHADYGYWSLTS